MRDRFSREHLGITSHHALQFFFDGLKDCVPESVRKEDIGYPATVLATFSQVSCFSQQGIPASRSLRELHKEFLDPASPISAFTDFASLQYEMLGAQCLWQSGYFSEQRYNSRSLAWYGKIGSRMFLLASQSTIDKEREAKMAKMSLQFDLWQEAFYRLSVYLSGNMFLLKV